MDADETTKICFTVPGRNQPESKRHWGRFTVDTAKAKDFKALVALCASQVAPEAPLEGPLRVTVTFRRLKPKSWPKYKNRPTTKPDLTNLYKILEDALTGIIWRDDAQVVDEHPIKEFGVREEAVVEIETLDWGEPPGAQQAVD